MNGLWSALCPLPDRGLPKCTFWGSVHAGLFGFWVNETSPRLTLGSRSNPGCPAFRFASCFCWGPRRRECHRENAKDEKARRGKGWACEGLLWDRWAPEKKCSHDYKTTRGHFRHAKPGIFQLNVVHAPITGRLARGAAREEGSGMTVAVNSKTYPSRPSGDRNTGRATLPLG